MAHPLLGRLSSRRGGAHHSVLRQKAPGESHPLAGEYLRFSRLPHLAASLVLFPPGGSAVSVPRAIRLDPQYRRSVLPRHRRDQPASGPAHHHAWLHLHSVFLDGHHRARERVLRDDALSPDRDAGRLRVPRLLPLLRLLGSHAGPHVLPHRGLGWATEALRRHQVLPLYLGG